MLETLLKFLLILKNIALFFLAPFIALAYIMVLPILGMFMITRLSMELIHNKIKESTEVRELADI